MIPMPLRAGAAVAPMTLFGLPALLAALWLGHPFGAGLHPAVGGLGRDAGALDTERHGGTGWRGVVAPLMLVTGVLPAAAPIVPAPTGALLSRALRPSSSTTVSS